MQRRPHTTISGASRPWCVTHTALPRSATLSSFPEGQPLALPSVAAPHTVRAVLAHASCTQTALWDTRVQAQSRSRDSGSRSRTLDHSPPSSPGFPRALSPTACDRAFSVPLRNHILRPSACQHRGCPVSRSITSGSPSPSTRLGCTGRRVSGREGWKLGGEMVSCGLSFTHWSAAQCRCRCEQGSPSFVAYRLSQRLCPHIHNERCQFFCP